MAPKTPNEVPAAAREAALASVAEQVGEGIGARKCGAAAPCGCFHAAVAAFERTEAGRRERVGEQPTSWRDR